MHNIYTWKVLSSHPGRPSFVSHHSREINCFLITISTEHLIAIHPQHLLMVLLKNHICTIGKFQVHVLARRDQSNNISILATCLELANVNLITILRDWEFRASNTYPDPVQIN
ncbi:hypothetical protein Peur_056347 [Populus x canadensis]|jgi:hypothetical protein